MTRGRCRDGRVAWLLLYLMATLGLVTLGCGAEAPPVLRYTDLVTQGAWTSSRGEVAPAVQGFCADETHFAQPLAAGETLTAEVEVGEDAQWIVGGCLDGAPLSAGESVVLQVIFEGETGTSRVRTAHAPPTPQWWQHQEDLSGLAGRTVTVSITRQGGVGRGFFLREAYLRHRRPAPAATEQGGEGPAHAPRADEPPPQILLISVDTLRADAIAALGGPWSTPHLDALVAESQSFTRSWSVASWTKPSHASLLTGHSPQTHGALSQVTGMHPAVETVAERLQRADLVTGGLVQDIVHLDPRFGFDRGFDSYRTEHWSLPHMARYTADWVARHRDRPFFFFLHTFEVHSDFNHLPYEAPGVRIDAVDERFGVERYGCAPPFCASGRLAQINEGNVVPLPNEAEILRYLYGQGVTHTDGGLGTLFDDLRTLGVWDRLMIVLTSDHGEAFLEHGEVLHGDHWEPILRVPLVIKWPGGALGGTRSALNVSGLDVTPTVLAAVGQSLDGMPGTDVRALRRGDRPLMLGTYERTLIHEGFKLMVKKRDGPVRLFALETDPQEQDNLAETRPAIRSRLMGQLRVRNRAASAQRERLDALGVTRPEQPLTDEERARLEALGYLDG